MKISRTAEIHGRGSQPWKWISGLTETEKNAVKNGEIVLVPDPNPHPETTEYKRVILRNDGRGYTHRNYNRE